MTRLGGRAIYACESGLTADAEQAIVKLERRYDARGSDVLDALRGDLQERGRIGADEIKRVASKAGLPDAAVYGAASFYSDLGFKPRGRRHIRVCAGTSCFATTGGAHIGELERELQVQCGGVSDDGEVSLEPVYCLGYCYASPAALDGEEPCAGLDLVEQLTGAAPRRDPEIPFASAVDEPVLLAGLLGVELGAWQAWADVIHSGGAERVHKEVLDSGLRGRGGAGFAAARKWQSAAESPTDGPRYMICNGDEGDPGSYTDRLLMERDPHRVLEGIALAALAARATKGFVYVRSEYPRARDALREAIERARADGHLGNDVHGTGIDFDIELFEGAGSYVAGEETSLIHSIEGLRGGVTARPPYPTEHGLYGRPTVVNNVGTLAAVPWIVARGGRSYARLGSPDSTGTALVCFNQLFERPGAYEVELGTSLGTICNELGGGLRDGQSLRSLQVGGPLGGLLAPGQLDTPLTFAALESAGVALGHASLIALDERVSGSQLLEHLWTFAARETCGTCAPCRVGCTRGLELAERAGSGAAPNGWDRDLQEALLGTMEMASLCAFGRSVPLAVRSILRVYADEFTLGGDA